MGKHFKEKCILDRAINEMCDFFKSNILKILQESVPSKMSSSRFSKPWINRTVKQMTRRKKRSFDKARRTKKKSDIARYRKLKSATQKECRKAYKDYVENIIDPYLSSNPKRFWSFIKSKHCESTGVSPLKDSDGKT
jgi:polyphosphate kinase